MLRRFSNGSLQALPRSPFAGPLQEAALRNLYTSCTPAALNASLIPALCLDTLGLTPAQQHVRQAGKRGRTAADMYCAAGGSSLGIEAAQQPLLAAAAAAAAAGGEARNISRINSADDSSADAQGNTHGKVPCTHILIDVAAGCTIPAVVNRMLHVGNCTLCEKTYTSSHPVATSPSNLQHYLLLTFLLLTFRGHTHPA